MSREGLTEEVLFDLGIGGCVGACQVEKEGKIFIPAKKIALEEGSRGAVVKEMSQTDAWLSLQNYGSGMRPPPNSLGPAMPGINMGPGAGRPWPNPNSANSIPYSSSSPGTYVGPPGGGGPPGTPIMPSPADSTNSSDNIYTMINPVPPGGSRSNFPMGPGSDGPMGGMGGMEPHHMNGSLGSGDIDGLPKNSPNNISGISNPPGTPRDDGELGGNFLHSFQNDNYSPSMTMSV
ncbi:hypothetical protein J1605_012553 [Eschrichtius robustus]|uniref:Single-stranded DNA-binding protein 3 n=1 Tax=Eschrichtius robustus TaxID=9764 RepID=A0AB34GJA2_ESCRO|nr:hypothetical protein J1605_012553 [Eschrichtius robustus]